MSNIIKFKRRRVSQGIILSGTTANNENGIVAKDLSRQDLMFYKGQLKSLNIYPHIHIRRN